MIAAADAAQRRIEPCRSQPGLRERGLGVALPRLVEPVQAVRHCVEPQFARGDAQSEQAMAQPISEPTNWGNSLSARMPQPTGPY